MGPDRILYGSDFPYAPPKTIFAFNDDLKGAKLSDEVREEVYNGNAKQLFSGW